MTNLTRLDLTATCCQGFRRTTDEEPDYEDSDGDHAADENDPDLEDAKYTLPEFIAWESLKVLKIKGCSLFHKSTLLSLSYVQEVHISWMPSGATGSHFHCYLDPVVTIDG